jgi:murein DD-endopeptidase MepM/ murein hydrolase activator NlpD
MMHRWRDLVFMIPVVLGAVLAAHYIPMGPAALPVLEQTDDNSESEWIEPTPVQTHYGIPVSLFQVSNGQVRRGESLAELLYPYGVNSQQIYTISLLADSLIDERKIQQGNRYSVFSTNDTTPVYFIYEKDPLNYVMIGLDPDSIWAENRAKSVEQRLQIAKGTIESSLWESMQAANANPMLAVELSEIFAWSIDFFGIQQGDRFKVIYEESYVDSLSIGITRINGAWFYHNNTDFWGIPFEQDGVISFFDEKGNSLRKAFLKAPLRFSRISSGFSHSRYHPVLKIRRPHHGVDYAAPAGTPVLTVGDGVVTSVGYQKSGGGNFVSIKHNSVYSTTYMHLSKFGKGIKKGRYVKQGDVIGYVGSTGLATGPHLDFRFYKNGSAVNPLKVEAPPVEPVYEENLSAYGIRKNLTIGLLKLI